MWEKQLCEKMRLEFMTYEILLSLDFLRNHFKEEILQNPVSPKNTNAFNYFAGYSIILPQDETAI